MAGRLKHYICIYLRSIRSEQGKMAFGYRSDMGLGSEEAVACRLYVQRRALCMRRRFP